LPKGLVSVDHARHQVLVLTDASRALLRGERTLQMRRPKAEPGRRAGRGARRARAESANGSAVSQAGIGGDAVVETLFERLKQWRRATASERGVAAVRHLPRHDAARHRRAPPGTLASWPGSAASAREELDAYGAQLIDLIGSTAP